MGTHHRWLSVACATGVLALALGCAGDLPPNTPPKDAGKSYEQALRFDQTPLPSWDQGLPTPDSAPRADQGVPVVDSGPRPDTSGSGGLGDPCAAPSECDDGLLCILGACRNPCNQPPTDACGAISDCGDTEACLPTTQTGVWVCMPATTVGSPCDGQTFCPNHTVCASVNAGANICLPVCTVVGQACGTGGNCLSAGNGCLVCSKP